MRHAFFFSRLTRACVLSLTVVCLCVSAARTISARACVWKVSSGEHTLYLAGSIHVLRQSDYPLPPEYGEAYEASTALAFETDLTTQPAQWAAALQQAGQLPRGVTLRDRVDPRTYAYILRLVGNVHGATDPEKKIEHLRPWALAMLLRTTKGDLLAGNLGAGVEGSLIPMVKRDHKKTVGLVPFKEHIAVFGGMSDTDSEIYLLHSFIHLDTRSVGFANTVAAWKRGDSDALDRMFRQEYSDAPSIRQRMIVDRNRVWLPKIEGFLNSDQTWMVVAGATHMSGSDGLPAMLRARGYQVEQL